MSLLNLDSKLSEKQRKGAYGSGLIGVGALLLAQVYGFVSPDQFQSIVKLVTVVGGTLGLGGVTTAFDVLKRNCQDLWIGCFRRPPFRHADRRLRSVVVG